METVSYMPSIYVVGVKRRCRKKDGHSFRMESIPYKKSFSDSEIGMLKSQAMTKVGESMKSYTKVSLTLYKETRTGCVTMWSPFDEDNIKVSIV